MPDFEQMVAEALTKATDVDRNAVEELFAAIAHGTPPDPPVTFVTPGMAAIIADERQPEDGLGFVDESFVEQVAECGQTGHWMPLWREIEVDPQWGCLNSDGLEKMLGVIAYGKPVSFRFWMPPLPEKWPSAVVE